MKVVVGEAQHTVHEGFFAVVNGKAIVGKTPQEVSENIAAYLWAVLHGVEYEGPDE